MNSTGRDESEVIVPERFQESSFQPGIYIPFPHESPWHIFPSTNYPTIPRHSSHHGHGNPKLDLSGR